MQLLDGAREKWKAPDLIPGWCCDGIHCAGNDIRFAGMWHLMYAVCRAFEYYARVDPEDPWMSHFHCYDGLMIKEGVERPANSIDSGAMETL
jgi:hypothetical protein